ncbi:MAG: Ser-Thr-rich GPI-anchored membrane family protein [Patescibacteria group bacterium]
MKLSLTGARVTGVILGLLSLSISGVASAGMIYGGGYGSYGSYQQVYPTYSQPIYAYPTYPQTYNYQPSYYSYPSYPVQYPYPYTAGISITKPARGDDFDDGDRMTIKWRTEDEPSRSDVRLDLYSASGNRVWTIATVSSSKNEYRWTIPEDNEFCTYRYQYQNTFCGGYRSGSYYIQATLVTRSGYGIASDTSGLFTIRQHAMGGSVWEFSARPTSGYEPLRVTFTIAAEGGDYTIDFDDGDDTDIRIPAIYCFAAPCVPPPQYVTHIYRDRGTFDVTLEDDDGDIVGRESIRVR